MSQESNARELAHHEALYSGFAQEHFAKPAVRALRRHMVGRILSATGAGKNSRVLSLGCGIADTELLLAAHTGFLTGIDLAPAAIRQARADAARSGLSNVEFLESSIDRLTFVNDSFEVIVAIFFLHHLPDAELGPTADRIYRWLIPGGVFYGLDPSYYRLSGALGSLLVPHLMRRYQTPDERELKPREMESLFSSKGFEARSRYYDFVSSPLAGLLPSWGGGYRVARVIDNALIRVPLLRSLGSNFELIAGK
jgi:SAM-dependent methyltransferase